VGKIRCSPIFWTQAEGLQVVECAAAEVLGVGEEQRRVVPVDHQSRDRPRLRVVVDIVHARQLRHQALDGVVRAAYPEQRLGDRQAHGRSSGLRHNHRTARARTDRAPGRWQDFPPCPRSVEGRDAADNRCDA